jgi:Rrf2 family protein
MKTSVKGEYALLAVFDLAAQPTANPVKIADIARRQNVPQKFLELILAALKQGGFVESRRGAEGGYLLARAPEGITVGDVLRFVEWTRGGKPRGRRRSDDPFADMWRKVDEAVSEIVDRTSFAKLVRAWADKQHQYVANWEI